MSSLKDLAVRPLRFGPVLFALLLTTALTLRFASPAQAWEEQVVDGTLHVMNPAAPSEGVRTIELKEQWRAGGEDDEEVFFGLITQTLADDEGNTYLLDTQLSQVYVFDADGAFVHPLSREGEGPGEITRPTDMLMLDDGILGLVQAFPGKIIKIDLEGNPAGDFSPHIGDAAAGGFLAVIDAKSCNGRFYLGGSHTTMHEGGTGRTTRQFVGLFKDDGGDDVIFHETSFSMEFDNLKIREVDQYTPSRRVWAVYPDGRVVLAPERNEYRLNVYNPDGTLERVIEREFESRPRNDLENKRIDAIFAAQTRNIPIEIDFTKAETEQDIATISLDDDGYLWVQTSRSGFEQPAGVMLTFDIFDPEGHFVRQCPVTCDGDPMHDGLLLTGGSRMVLVRGFIDAALAMQAGGALEMEDEEDPAPMEVISYAW